MGISHPLSDDYDALRGAVLSPERTPPSSPPPPPPNHHFLEHEVSRMDTLAGIAIKYGVEISDIKRANGLVSDSQMFAHKTLLIPLPGRPMPSSVRLTKRAWAPSNQQNRQGIDSSKYSSQHGASPAMDTLQRYYGLTSQTTDCSTEMSVYRKGSFQSSLSETLVDSEAPGNGLSAATKGGNGSRSSSRKQDGSMRRRQKGEGDCNAADTQDDFLADPIKVIKSLLPRPISSIRLNMDTGGPVRKSPSTPNFADAENGVSSTKWSFNHESFTRPLLDGRRTKTALD